jgi:hypothetical protein
MKIAIAALVAALVGWVNERQPNFLIFCNKIKAIILLKHAHYFYYLN